MIVDVVKGGQFIQKAKLEGKTVYLDGLPLQNKIICLDPGHGGKERANVGYSGKYVEPDGVLDICLKLAQSLRDLGADVVLTRDTDKTLSLSERCAIAEKVYADIIISVHSDASNNTKAKGATTFYSFKPLMESRNLAISLIEEYTNYTGTPSRGACFRMNSSNTDDYYGVLRGTSMPAVIIECAFHTNPSEEAKLLTPEFRILAAEGIKLGILRYFKN